MNKLIMECVTRRAVFRITVVIMLLCCDLIQLHMAAVVKAGGVWALRRRGGCPEEGARRKDERT